MTKRLEKIKGIIFQHSPMNDVSQNGRTMSVFMSKLNPNNLGQIYVTDFPIDFNRCKNSYRIIENNLVKHFFRKDIQVGKEVLYDDNETSYSGVTFGPDINRFLSAPKIKCYIQLIRSFFWKKRYWDTKDFASWIEKVHPDFILFTSGPIPEEYYMANLISKRYGLHLILYVSDDYVTEPDYFFFGKKRYYQSLKDAFTEVYKNAELTISISDNMKDHIQATYGHNNGEHIVAMNAVKDIKRNIKKHKKGDPLLITYMGNLGIGRLETIERLAIEMNSHGFKDSKIFIYTASVLTRKEKNRLKRIANIVLYDAVYGEIKTHVIEESDVLLHVESFDPRYKRILSTAMSTKTPELLQSRLPLLIVGPEYSSTISFFQKNDFGIIVNKNDSENYNRALQQLINNDDIVYENKKSAYEYYVDNYTEEIIGKNVANAIQNIIKDDCQ